MIFFALLSLQYLQEEEQGYILNIGYHIKAYKKKIVDAICQQGGGYYTIKEVSILFTTTKEKNAISVM
jgi:hypothetical protein